MTKKQNSIKSQQMKKMVDSNFKKYKKTYQLLDQYDKSPQQAPSYEAEYRNLQRVLRLIS